MGPLSLRNVRRQHRSPQAKGRTHTQRGLTPGLVSCFSRLHTQLLHMWGAQRAAGGGGGQYPGQQDGVAMVVAFANVNILENLQTPMPSHAGLLLYWLYWLYWWSCPAHFAPVSYITCPTCPVPASQTERQSLFPALTGRGQTGHWAAVQEYTAIFSFVSHLCQTRSTLPLPSMPLHI